LRYKYLYTDIPNLAHSLAFYPLFWHGLQPSSTQHLKALTEYNFRLPSDIRGKSILPEALSFRKWVRLTLSRAAAPLSSTRNGPEP